jgi:hypothetical protein
MLYMNEINLIKFNEAKTCAVYYKELNLISTRPKSLIFNLNIKYRLLIINFYLKDFDFNI